MGGVKTSPEEDTSYLRRIRKPLVERRRRERMNQSIDQLKDLVADTIKHNVAPMTRVDKADILELTVTHIVQLQQQQQRGVAAAADASGYSSGYKDCARAVVDFLVTNSLVNGTALADLSGHLHNAYLNKSRRHQLTTYSTPIRLNHVTETPTATPAQLYGYSPIPQSTPDFPASRGSLGTCHTDQTSLSAESSGESSSFSSMEYSTGDSNSTRHSYTTGTSLSNYKSGRSTDLVTIGDGSENAIGHVIKDSVWRPW